MIPPMRDRLRAATRAAHERLDLGTGLTDPGLTRELYRRILARLHGFWAGGNRARRRSWGRMRCGPRRRLALLRADLLALGMTDAEVVALPLRPAPPMAGIPGRARIPLRDGGLGAGRPRHRAAPGEGAGDRTGRGRRLFHRRGDGPVLAALPGAAGGRGDGGERPRHPGRRRGHLRGSRRLAARAGRRRRGVTGTGEPSPPHEPWVSGYLSGSDPELLPLAALSLLGDEPLRHPAAPAPLRAARSAELRGNGAARILARAATPAEPGVWLEGISVSSCRPSAAARPRNSSSRADFASVCFSCRLASACWISVVSSSADIESKSTAFPRDLSAISFLLTKKD